MSVVLGQATVSGSKVNFTPPEGGFGGILAVRLGNYTGDVIVLTNINSDSPGQEYLLPFQQNVYHIENVRNPPTAVGIALGANFATASLLVEWSTDPLHDFPGTYPTSLTQAGVLSTAASAWSVNELAVPNSATTVTIPANSLRTSLTVFVDGANAVEFSNVDSGWGTNPQIAAGTGRTIDTTAAVFFRHTGATASSVQWFDTHY